MSENSTKNTEKDTQKPSETKTKDSDMLEQLKRLSEKKGWIIVDPKKKK